ncbi:VOC family protein [Nonomuraea aurantiaca]|uniref:VOC family protein n=1 Tax=Nonomuraea aurantiaca TaxID=2878562 RepID=UPI001CD987C0|nr:VOC family protein [Nonomuraea aurantiaca]MCA2224362.1 VOC family protein [Nonomuraea aurantiaca]
MNILGVDNILVGVGDLARAREFYGGVLGLREKSATEEMALTDYVKQPRLSRLTTGETGEA